MSSSSRQDFFKDHGIRSIGNEPMTDIASSADNNILRYEHSRPTPQLSVALSQTNLQSKFSK